MTNKTVTMTIFDHHGQPANTFAAEVATEDKDTVTIKFPLNLGRKCLNTHCKKTGLLLSGPYQHLPQYTMMDAKEPVKDAFANVGYREVE